MSNRSTPSSCFCITGHGRSGTSFVTEMLQSAGLDVGERLMGPSETNPHGHFEDMDFHEFHVAVLTSQGYGIEGYILEPAIRVQEQFVGPARSMVEARRRGGRPWGWKEPRSTLFLEFWADLIPEARFLLLFRRPWDVIDSLFRRGDPTYKKNPNLAVQVWLNYNRTLMDFYGRFPDRCLLIESHAAAADPSRLTDAIASKFGDQLGSIGEIYEDKLFRHEVSTQQRAVLGHFFPEAVTLYEQLRSRADLVEEQAESGLNSIDQDWALQDWVDLRHAQSHVRGLTRHFQSELDETRRRAQAELEQARAEVSSQRSELAGTRSALELARDSIVKLSSDASQVESERRESRAQLAKTAIELDQANADRERLNQLIARNEAHLAWVESSKFWKLRLLWIGLRSRLRRRIGPSRRPEAVLPDGRIDRAGAGMGSQSGPGPRGANRDRVDLEKGEVASRHQ
jgi:O-antigen biosynthesis protein